MDGDAQTVFARMSTDNLTADWFGTDTVDFAFPGVTVTVTNARVRLPQVTEDHQDEGQETEYRGTVRVLTSDLGTAANALDDFDLLRGVIEYDSRAYGIKSITRPGSETIFELEEHDPVRRTRPGYHRR